MSLSETDSYFSSISEKQGRNAAFLAMFDSSAVMLTQNSMPIEGKFSIRKHLLSSSDRSYILTWKPLSEFKALSNDMGYTYGTYLVRHKQTKDTLAEGTYVTIWKKDANNKWKAVLDTGNEGLKNNINQKHTNE